MRRSLLWAGAIGLALAAASIVSHASDEEAVANQRGEPVPRWMRTGLITSTPEQRELIAEALPPSLGKGTLPPAVDLSKWFPKPRSQGEQGTCASWALANYRTYLLARHRRADPDRDEVRASPAFIFSQIGDLKNCQGSSLESGMEFLKTKGSVSERDYPYVNDKLGCQRASPASELFEKAKPWRTAGWGRVELREPYNANDLKVFLANREPIVFAMEVGPAFDRLGKEVMRERETGEGRGSHAMVLVGYDDSRGAFKILNSWGERWGDDGFGWVSYEVFMKEWKYGYVASDRTINAPALLGQVKDDYVHAVSGKMIRVRVLDNDEYDKKKPPRIYLTNMPRHGKAKVVNDQIVYLPDAGYVGADRFYYALVDGLNRRGAAMVEVAVEGKGASKIAEKADGQDNIYERLKSASGVQARFPQAGIISGALLRLKVAGQGLEARIDNLELSPHGDSKLGQAILQGGEYRICGAIESRSLGGKRKMKCGLTRRKGKEIGSESLFLPLKIPARQLLGDDVKLWLVVQAHSVDKVSGGAEQLNRLLAQSP